MRFFQIFAFSIIFFCLSNAGTLRADAYLKGFQALEQRDYKTALYYLSLFAANGDGKANYNLGLMYREGLGVEKDDVQSLSHFIEAAHMLGNYAVGLAFLTGKGSDVDAEAAIHYLSEAALLGHAMVEIGGLYFRGRLVEKFCFCTFLVVTGTRQKRSRCFKKFGCVTIKNEPRTKKTSIFATE